MSLLLEEKIAEISEHFIHPVHCIIVEGSTNRRYSCSPRDFAEKDYDELLEFVTGLADYKKSRQLQPQKMIAK